MPKARQVFTVKWTTIHDAWKLKRSKNLAKKKEDENKDDENKD